jgi:hypothetical protein
MNGMRVFAMFVLAAVAASIANATSFSEAIAENSVTNTSYSGPDVTVSCIYSYAYANYYNGSGSFGAYSDYSFSFGNGLYSDYSDGFSYAFPQLHGSYDVNTEGGWSEYAITNNNARQAEYAFVFLYEVTDATALGDSNGYGYASAETYEANLTTGDWYSVGSSAESGHNSPGIAEFYSSYSLAGASGSSFSITRDAPNTYTGGPHGGGYTNYYGLERIDLAPGATDILYLEEGTFHEAYSTTPSPATAAPFAIGLLALLRGTRKRRKA